MKKIFILLFSLTLLASCSSKSTLEESESGTLENSSIETWTVMEDDSAKDPAVLWTKEEMSSTQANLPASNTSPQTTTGTQDTKTEDAIVKDFEAEIDGLLNTIEKDGGKK